MKWAGLVLCVGLFQAVPAFGEIRRVLLSVDGLSIPPTKSIRSFHIETWGVDLLAVCHAPPSWELKSEKFEDPEGYLDGLSDMHGEQFTRISEMDLVDVYDYQPRPHGDPKHDYHPASFAGWVVIGRVQPFDGGTRNRRTLNASNFRLRDASRCPIPPPAQP